MSSLLTASTPRRQTSLIDDYVVRALAAATPAPARIRLLQTGEMWMKPGGRAVGFSAVEELSVDEVAFTWRANVHVAPLVSMHVVDQYRDGKGLIRGSLLGIPRLHSQGAETDAAQAMRYLAELAWVPHAVRLNRHLDWREIEDDIVEVSAPVGQQRVAVRLRFDADGDILAVLGQRPRITGQHIVATRWIAVFSAYDELGGIRIPTRAEVRWELPDGPFTYWIGEVTAVDPGAPSSSLDEASLRIGRGLAASRISPRPRASSASRARA
jgi:hypothetical protein